MFGRAPAQKRDNQQPGDRKRIFESAGESHREAGMLRSREGGPAHHKGRHRALEDVQKGAAGAERKQLSF